MSLQHFYLDEQVLADEVGGPFPLRLAADDAKHARVLRLAPGERIAVVDAVRDYFACEIVAFDGVLPVVRIAQRFDAKKAAAKAGRWRAIAKSAAMQSGQPAVPDVREPAGLREACALLADADALLVCWEEAPGASRLDVALDCALGGGRAAQGARVAVVVGPEGGLAEREVEALLACNPRSSLVSLGPSILRTETAGIVAPALALYELERRARAGAL